MILCMAHRGRLNLLTDLLQYPAVLMFRKVGLVVIVIAPRL